MASPLPPSPPGAPPALFSVLFPDGTRAVRPLPADPLERLRALQRAVGGPIEYLSPAFHALAHFDVVLNEEGADVLPPNAAGCARIGYDLVRFRPLCGPLALVPRRRPVGPDRAREVAFFERLARGEALGWDAVIDAREADED